MKTKEDIETLVQRFIDRTLPKEEWTHEAHLLVALWHAIHFKEEETICFLRSRIISYNQALGGENTPTAGYHETLTLFWIKVVYHFLKNENGSLEELCDRFLESKFSKRDYPFQFYTKELIVSIQCRAIWTEPDFAIF